MNYIHTRTVVCCYRGKLELIWVCCGWRVDLFWFSCGCWHILLGFMY